MKIRLNIFVLLKNIEKRFRTPSFEFHIFAKKPKIYQILDRKSKI